MSLSAANRINPLHGFRPGNLTGRKTAGQPTAPARTVIPFRSTQAVHAQHILMVEFTSPNGRSWQAIGGGDTLAEAIAFAQDSCPADATWQPVSWNDLYGD